jgi:hypothetical protein
MPDPHKCPECSRVFNWGLDADSASVEREGEQWLSCRENAYWKLNFHMLREHPDVGFKCPRRYEGSMFRDAEFNDYWHEREGSRACSYCGSAHPDELFACVETGYEVVPTDKNYKIYFDQPDARSGQRVEIGGESGPAYNDAGKPNKPDLTMAEKLSGRYDRKLYGTAAATRQNKFYFQHLSRDEMQRFIDLYNNKTMKVGTPGHFYVRPYFMKLGPE